MSEDLAGALILTAGILFYMVLAWGLIELLLALVGGCL